MGFDDTAYRALGITPGADAAAVEAAYRKLIKRYHPDRKGGDSSRAAEINWAYDHIRKARRLPQARRAHYPVVQPAPPHPRGSGLRLAALSVLIGALVLLADERSMDSLKSFAADLRQPATQRGSYQPAPIAGGWSGELSDQPLDTDAIERSVESAIRLVGSGDPDRIARQSRRCHAELRSRPDLSRFDQCVAFDEAVVALANRDSLADSGQFAASAVTVRQIGAARMFPDSYLLIESRLDRIRAAVEFALAPPDPRPTPGLEL